ncbi:hypothetical protein ACOSP7_001388 [Xanthoceras sorbifolium]
MSFCTKTLLISTTKVIIIFYILNIVANPLVDARPVYATNKHSTSRVLAVSIPQDRAPVPPAGPNPCTHIPTGAPGHCKTH